MSYVRARHGVDDGCAGCRADDSVLHIDASVAGAERSLRAELQVAGVLRCLALRWAGRCAVFVAFFALFVSTTCGVRARRRP